ncbi:related to menaquinone biosynthesis methyltransferase ubiE [Melanopsichium pennsylvanicum]|uniref:Related to menaquinone biosynthesis methyltransferase ubiE n=2 Tax=Melanopsichium pennsylvanicum TaxID=63383 RepID=A0AAJ4XSL7_9BASI|nr:type 11 methyltransferase [Melanopsichium pennsylvanicum 4]SNX87141.1 related to menaquinone biosynthesis methyltransferase ubiE [Melanopsichium pennsylvanicum]
MSDSKSTYTQGYSEAVLKSHSARTAENSAAFLLPYLRPNFQILDIGCGPGTITTSLASYIPDGCIIGTDYSAQVVAKAQKRLNQLRTGTLPNADRTVADRVTFQIASVLELPYLDDTFDVVYCHQMLLHLPDPVSALKEMRRVCKPGGLIAAREADFSTCVQFPETATFQTWLDTATAIYRSTGAEPNAGRRLVRWALDAGYQAGEGSIVFSSSNQAWSGQPGAKFWGAMWAERIAAQGWKQQALGTGLVKEEQINQMKADWELWSDTPDGVFVMVCGEVLLKK